MVHPNDALALMTEARRASNAGEHRRAEDHARRALLLSPHEPTAFAILAFILSNDPEQLVEAGECAAVAVEMAPDERQFRHLAVTIALQSGRFELAYDQSQQVRALWPHDVRSIYHMAVAANALGHSGAAAPLLDYDCDVQITHSPNTGLHDDIAQAVIAAVDIFGANRPGTMSGGLRLEDAFQIAAREAGRLRSLLEDAVGTYHQQRRGSAQVSRAWANIIRADEFERSHIHETATLSGVYYPAVVDRPASRDEGCLIFGPHHFGPAVPPLPQRRIIPRKGDVVVFPSWFPHATQPFSGSGTRISIAFDVT